MKNNFNVGSMYDPEDSEFIRELIHDVPDDSRFYAKLYRAKNGKYFIDGEGGFFSPFATDDGYGGTVGGSGIVYIGDESARTELEMILNEED